MIKPDKLFSSTATRRAWQKTMSALLPSHCLLCEQPASNPFSLCETCLASLPRNQIHCDRCAVPLVIASTCGQCLKQPPPFSYAVAPWVYSDPINRLVSTFKHHAYFTHGHALAQPLLQTFCEQTLLPDALIPIPLHWKKRWQRGFNQSLWLARYLSRATGIPVLNNVARRIRYTPSQQGLPRQQRMRNLKGCFAINQPLQGKKIVLIDDVMTTGSTVRELSRTLLQAGADEVIVWCLARTPLEK